MAEKRNKQKIFVLAGESSGDLHGSYLMKHLKIINPLVSFVGVGGPKMKKEGLESIIEFKHLAVMGFWEVIKKYSFFVSLEKKILSLIINDSPDQIILIDYPGLNLRLAKKIKQRQNIPIFYYISPQLWAWKEKRVQIIKQYVDHMIGIFPFEPSWYKKRGLEIQYFGHPIIDQIKQDKLNTNLRSVDTFSLNTIALFPGSREQEVGRHLPVLLDFIKKYSIINPNINFILSCAPNINSNFFNNIQSKNVKLDDRPLPLICCDADLAIVASGTATLECAMYNVPMVVIYKMSLLSWLITKYFIKIKFASIVNILCGRFLVSEVLQSRLIVDNLIYEINNLEKVKQLKYVYDGYDKIRKELGSGHAYEGAAQYIINN